MIRRHVFAAVVMIGLTVVLGACTSSTTTAGTVSTTASIVYAALGAK